MEGEDDNALLNACVLGRLFEFVDVESLKRSRLVCHTWNRIAGRALLKRATVYFRWNSGRDFMTTSKRELREFNEILNDAFDENSKCIHNVRIDDIDNATWEVAKNTIISTSRNSIQSLVLTISPEFTYDDSFAHCLLSLPSLEHLEIWEWGYVNNFGRDIFGLAEFSKLKSCTARFPAPLNEAREELSFDTEKTRFLINFLKSCSGTLKKLDLKQLPHSCYKAVFEEVDFKGLTHLTLGGNQYSSKMPIEIFESLPTFCPNLVHMEYNFPKAVNYMDFQNIILSNLKNLRSIKIVRKFEEDGWRYTPLGVVPQSMTFPIFPAADSVSLNIPFAGDVGILAKCFPVTRKLKIVLLSTEDHQWKPMPHLEELSLRERISGPAPIEGFAHLGLSSKDFPNLTKLVVRLKCGSAKGIFENLGNLRELIILDGSWVTDEDITGIRTEDLAMADEGKIARTNPYIGDLKNLQVVHIGSWAISTDSITYGIADLEFVRKFSMRCPRYRFDHPVHGGELGRPRPRDESSHVDLEPLMLPKAKYLVHMTILVLKACSRAVDSKQLKRMKEGRPGFFYETVAVK